MENPTEPINDEEPAWWVLEEANESNRLEEIQEFLGIPIVALVSEADGGIVAYGRADIMEACAEALNDVPDDWEGI